MSSSGDVRRTAALFRRFAVGQRRAFVFGLIFLAVEAATAVFQPYPLAYLVDFLKGAKHGFSFARSHDATIGVLTGAIVVIAAINSLMDSLAEIALAKGGRAVGYNLRVALYRHLQRLSLSFHHHRKTGDVLTRITGDVLAIEEFVVESVSDLAGSVLLLVGTLAFLLTQSVQVTLLALVIMPVLASVSNIFAKRVKAAAKKLRAREGDLASAAQEMLSSIGLVQIYGRGGYEQRKFAEHSKATADAQLRTARIEAVFGFTVSLLEAIIIAVVVWIGVLLIDRKATTVGTLVLFILLIENMFKPTKRIIKEWNSVGKVYASVERISELLQREPAVADAPDAVEAPPLQGEIEFRDVSFAYQGATDESNPNAPQRLALDSMNFTINAGEVVALVGHSGAGKSTVAQLIPRLYDPHAGAVLIDEYDIRQFTLESLRAQISMVLQETVLLSGTVAENIGYGREGATREEIITAAKLANAHDFISAMPQGYDSVLGERAATLSGGQRQRLAIARAFIRDTPILVLDEPTTGLDAESSDLVLQALHTLLKGKTGVIVSHDLNLIRAADRIMVISAGKILEEGTSADLLARGGLYAELHARQFGAVIGEEVAVPSSPAIAEIDIDEARAPERRRAFETVLMEALPLPASLESFRQLTGRMPIMSATSAADRELEPLQAPELTSALPGLTQALDPSEMAPRLQRLLADGWEIESCSPGKALVEPGEGATVRYRLAVRNPESKQIVEHLVGGRLFFSEDAAEHWLRDEVMPLASRAAGRIDMQPYRTPVRLVQPLRLVLHAFPIDPELPGLLDATDSRALSDKLGPIMAGSIEGLVLHECRSQVVQYARRGRCVLRYELLWRLGGSKRSLKQVVYGKVYADDQGAQVGPAATALHKYLQTRTGSRFLLPRFQGYLPELRLCLMEALPGTPQVAPLVRQRIANGMPPGPQQLSLETALDSCARIGAALHTSGLTVGPNRTLLSDIERTRAEVHAIAPFAPRLTAALEQRLADVSREAAEPALPSVLAHGDFTSAQILFDGPLSGLIDLDTVCMAEPALDLGQFVGYLDLTAAKARVSAGRPGGSADELSQLFLDDYLRANDGLADSRLYARVAAYRTLALVRVAVRSWRQLKPARVRLATDLLEQPSSVRIGALR